MDTGTIAIILWAVTVLSYVIYNLWKQVNKLQEIAEKQAAFINETKTAVYNVTYMFDKIDEANTFRSNDYVGHMWEELKNLNDALKQYK
jgi:hypothetical protein